MPDVFDQLDEEVKPDIFDQIESETVESTPPEERAPRGPSPSDFAEPEIPRPSVGDGPEDIPPGPIAPPRPFAATPEEFDARMAADTRRGKLQEERAGNLAEAEIIGNAERAINLAQEGVVSPDVAEKALTIGAPALNAFPGMRRSLAEAGSGLTSPVNAGLMLATGAGSAIPKIGGAVARGIAGGFAADIAGHMPELGTIAGEASVTGTPEQQQKAVADIGVSAFMGGLAGGGAFHIARPAIPTRIVETIAKAESVGLKKSAAAAAKTIDVEAKVEPVTKGEKSASEIPSPESLPQREVRTPVDEGTPLRQPGETADAPGQPAVPREPARAQGGEEADVLLKPEPAAATTAGVPPAELAADIARYNEIQAAFKNDPLALFGPLWKESETIKNKYGGFAPVEPAKAKPASILTELEKSTAVQAEHEIGPRIAQLPEAERTAALTEMDRRYAELSAQAKALNEKADILSDPAEVDAAISESSKFSTQANVIKSAADVARGKAKPGAFTESAKPTKSAPVTPEAPAKPREAATEFRKLIEEYGEQLGWILRPDLVHGRTDTRTGASGAAVKGKVAGDMELTKARRKAISELGGDPTKAMAADLAKLLPKLKERIAKYEAEQRALEQAAEVGVEGDLPAGSAPVEFVPGEASPVSPKAEIVSEKAPIVPKLAPGEKGTGDLLKTVEEPLKLVGEKGVDVERVAVEKASAEKASADAAARAAEAQGELPGTQGAIATAGPPLMPTPPAGVPATPVKAISQIIRDLAKGLDIPIRFGRLTTSKFAGYFKKNPNLIGAKFANDMPIVAHEAGHKLDTIYPFTKDTSIFPELDALGDPSVAGSRSSWTPSKSLKYKRAEGLAEFIRHWLTDPAQAQKLAPDTHALFERVLAANEDLSATMRQAQSDIQLWKNAPQEARLDSSISRSDPNKSRYRLPNLMRDVIDDLHFLRMAVDDAKVSGNLEPSQNPYQLARTLRGSFGMADTFIRKGITDFKTKEVRPGTGLEDALKPVAGRMDEFRRWIVAKRAQELRGQGKETGLVDGDVNFVANKYNGDPAFNEAFTKVKEWNDGLLQYAVDGGLIAPESAAKMRELHQDYVPFHRLFEVGAGEAPAVGGGGAGRGLNAGKPGSLKRLSGSARDIVDPLETMVKNAYTMITAAEKNAINTAVADLANKSDMGRWVERVAAPKELVQVELDRIRKQLEDAGADLTGVPDDLLMSFFKPSGRAPFGENIIKVNRAGKQEFYRLDKDLFDTFHALDQDSSSRLLKLISVPAQVLRAGTTLTPDFALSNAFRDTFGAAVLSKYTTYPFQATVRGIGAMLNNPKLVSEWAASGGKQSIEANYFDRAKLQKFLAEKISKDMTPADRAMVWAKSPLTALRVLTGTLEEATRIGEYKGVLKKLTDEGMPIGDARRQAAFEARDLQDFAKGGAQTKIIRSMAAFWNAGLQGNVRLVQAFKQRPFQTTLKGLAFITLPKLLEQALNWDDEDYWDRPQWERDLFFMIPRGKDENGHTKFLRLPTPFEMGVIFGTVPGRILQSMREKDPEAVQGLPGVMLRQAVPNPTPQSVLTLLELNAGKGGYSFFRGRPIVPSSLQNAPPELQFTSQNSLTAKKVGRLLNLPPAKVDYAISGLTGGVGKQLTHQVSDRAISGITGEERTAQSTTPGARFVATPAGVQSEAVEKFYRALEQATADAERVKAGEPSKGFAQDASALSGVARQMSDLRRLAREEKDETKRQAINLEIAELAKTALKIIKAP